MTPMRRRDREITDDALLDELIRRCDCIRLAFNVPGGAPYLVPLSFGFVHEGGARVFYLHCAGSGRKLDLLRQNPHVGFELDTGHAVNGGDTACEWSFRFESIIGTGLLCELCDPADKQAALRCLMAQYDGGKRPAGMPDGPWAFDPAMLKAVTVLRLTVQELSGKKHA